MKKSFLKLFAFVAVSAIVSTSCSSDNNNENVSTFVVDPNAFEGIIDNGEVTLNANTVYKLTGKLQINDGAILTIPAGTRIEATGQTSSYIAVAQGGKLNVNGTAAKPVVMTSGLPTQAAGDWGGLVICGSAPINSINGGAGTAQSEVADLTYGGTISNDNSGSIKYLRIEYAGAAFSSTKEFNGVSLFGVGSGTTFEYVETFHGADDGFEFFGGSVNTSNLISIGNEDDAFDWTEGWNGTNNNWFGKLDFGKGNRGIEADNYEFGYANTPISNPTINNITLIGAGSTASSATYTENQAFKFRRGTKSLVTNASISGWATGINVEHDETIAFVAGGLLKVTNITFNDVATKTKGTKTAIAPAAGITADVTAVYFEAPTTGAGNGTSQPTWADLWSVGF